MGRDPGQVARVNQAHLLHRGSARYHPAARGGTIAGAQDGNAGYAFGYRIRSQEVHDFRAEPCAGALGVDVDFELCCADGEVKSHDSVEGAWVSWFYFPSSTHPPATKLF